MKHAPWQYCNISYNSTNNAGDVSQSYNISCNNTNNIGYTIEKQWRLPHNNKYCFTITPTNYFGSGMQLNCKLLSCYCKQVWYFIGGCSSIQCENNNGGLPTWAIIVIVVAGIALIIILGIIIFCAIKKKKKDENKKKEEEKKKKKEEDEKKKEEEEKKKKEDEQEGEASTAL